MGLLSQLNCFSKKKSNKSNSNTNTQKHNNDNGGRGDETQTQSLLISRTTSSSPDSKRGKALPNSNNASSAINNNQNPYNHDDDSITMDSDYKQVQSGNYSVSDAGGTFNTQNNQSLSNFDQAGSVFGTIVGSSGQSPSSPSPYGVVSSPGGGAMDIYNYNNSHLMASPVSKNEPNNQQQHQNHGQTRQKEEILEIFAPSGKLGIVIDRKQHQSTPVVHAIKDTCPIANEIFMGDKLVAVDDVDVREMNAMEVSKLISKKSTQGQRKLTIIRGSHAHGNGGAPSAFGGY